MSHRNQHRRRPRHYPKQSMLRCASCNKIVCYSEAEAWSVALDIYNERGGRKPERVYPCPEDELTFHWTTLEVYMPKAAS